MTLGLTVLTCVAIISGSCVGVWCAMKDIEKHMDKKLAEMRDRLRER
jgi:uncharacterized protein YneF (UPF0154 family)